MAMDLIRELIDLRRAILTMGAAVEQRINHSIDALLKADLDAARVVYAGDDEIDRMELEIEQECLRVLALTHPVASDLRFVLAVMRINTNFERIGDMARSMAKRAIDMHQLRPVCQPRAIESMAAETRTMFSSALGAFSDLDAEAARRVRSADHRVDDLQKNMFAWAQSEIRRDVANTEAVIDLLSVARKLERICDVSTNIAEDVIFLIEGSLVRHAH